MLVFDGKAVAVPGSKGYSFLDDKRYGFIDDRDWRPRSVWVRNIVLHTRMGVAPRVEPLGSKYAQDRKWDEIVARRFSGDDRHASWHISVDADGSYVCHLDLVKIAAYHAGQMNDVSVGIEMYQTYPEGVLTQETINTTVRLVDVITRELSIQRQFPSTHKIHQRFARGTKGWRRSQELAYLPGGRSGADFVGVLGHRNLTRNRGKGDPGDPIFDALRAAKYEEVNVDVKPGWGKVNDLTIWSTRQKALGIHPEDCDGIPGPQTAKAIKANNGMPPLWKHDGIKHGLWIPRPGD